MCTCIQYGGYENIAEFTNEEGETDFDAAYDHANGLDEGDYEGAEGEQDTPDQEEATNDDDDQ